MAKDGGGNMNGVKIFVFVLLVLAFYSYVGQTVPQKITYPPESTELGGDMTPAQLAAAGEDVVSGKGTCLTCHTIGDHSETLRFPDLGGIGAAAADRIDGMTGPEYLAQSLYEPNEYIVEGFLAGMPAINRPPINLNDNEILAVIAYLESLGGEPTVTLDTEFEWQTGDTGQAAPAAPTAANAGGAAMDGPEVFQAYACTTCHAIDDATRGVGPSLYDIGARMSKAEIYEAIMDPDAVVAEGFPGTVMQATLTAGGFYSEVSSDELRGLVEYLSNQTGG
ncbi:MAG: cytochrome c [Rhodothermales bacterium]|nr:cytochrome c [Rhodothermales bacterium]